MSWYLWVLIILGVIIVLIVLIKMIAGRGEVSELDRRLGIIRGTWDSVCAKIKGYMVGC